VVSDTNVIFYLMMGVGVIGVIAKLVNQITLYRMVKAASNMSRSVHPLIKLVRAKYEHACMLHDTVENAGAFVEKYIYEYRGFLFRVHTWNQLELQCVWFSGILAIMGAIGHYLPHGFCETMYIYLAVGASEMVFLFVVRQLSNETIQMDATKNYMVDYLDNVCAPRYKKAKEAELLQKTAMRLSAVKETEEVEADEVAEANKIEAVENEVVETKSAEPMQRETVEAMILEAMSSDTIEEKKLEQSDSIAIEIEESNVEIQEIEAEESLADIQGTVEIQEKEEQDKVAIEIVKEPELSINIEGEPRALHLDEEEKEEKRPRSKEAAIRLILEEFFA
jgi:hypothetical protein